MNENGSFSRTFEDISEKIVNNLADQAKKMIDTYLEGKPIDSYFGFDIAPDQEKLKGNVDLSRFEKNGVSRYVNACRTISLVDKDFSEVKKIFFPKKVRHINMHSTDFKDTDFSELKNTEVGSINLACANISNVRNFVLPKGLTDLNLNSTKLPKLDEFDLRSVENLTAKSTDWSNVNKIIVSKSADISNLPKDKIRYESDKLAPELYKALGGKIR